MNIDDIKLMLRESGGSADLSVAERRAAMEAMTDMLPIPEGVMIEQHSGPIPGEWLEGKDTSPRRTILYLHGGAYQAGSPATHRSLAGAICLASRARALVIDYRLAPEHPFPAPVEDAVSAYKWMLGSGEVENSNCIPPEEIIVMGDSAGGALTLAMLVSAREQGMPMPAAAVCMSPWADLACSGVGYSTRAESDPIMQGDNIRMLAEAYLDGADSKHPLASPAYADLSGLPPLLIQVGSDEVLIGDSLLIEARAHACGVPATLEIWASMVHVWQAFHPMLEEGQKAIEQIASYMEDYWPDQP